MDLVIAGFSLITSAPSAQAAGGADTVSATPEALFAQLLDQFDGSPPEGESEFAARSSLLAARDDAPTAAGGSRLAARTESEIAARSSRLAARDESEVAGGDDDQDEGHAGGNEVVAPVAWQSLPVAPQPVAPPPEQRCAVLELVAERVEGVCPDVGSEEISPVDVTDHRERDRVASDGSRRPETERGAVPQAAVDFATAVSPVESASEGSPREVRTDVPPPGHAARALARALARLVAGEGKRAVPAEAGQFSPGHTDSVPRVVPKGAELAAALHRLAATPEATASSEPARFPTFSKAELRQSPTFESTPDVVAGAPAVPQGSAVEAPPMPTPASVPTAPQMRHIVEHTSLTAAREAAPPTPEDTEIVPQLVRAMRTHFRAGVGEARIRLNPEHLGEVRLSIRIDGDRVSALLHVERPEVQKAIESQSDSLRTGLAAQGFTLEHLSVNHDEQPPRQSASNEPEQRGRERGQPPPQRRARKREDDREFELAEG